MSNQGNVDQNLPPSPEDPDGLEGDDGSLVIEDENDRDYYLDRVERLLQADQRDELPTLYSAADQIFSARTIIAASGLPVNIDQSEFNLRLKKLLKQQQPTLPDVTGELEKFLFERAVHAHKLIAAWQVIAGNTKRSDLDEARQYLQRGIKRYENIRSLVREQREKMPSWMNQWAHYWLGAFEQIGEEIEAELRCTENVLDSIAGRGASARVEMESFILWRTKSEIRRQIAETPFGRSLEILLAAFSYAARLIPESEAGIDGYCDLIKQRASRVSRSEEKRTEALESFLIMMLEIPEQQSETQSAGLRRTNPAGSARPGE